MIQPKIGSTTLATIAGAALAVATYYIIAQSINSQMCVELDGLRASAPQIIAKALLLC